MPIRLSRIARLRLKTQKRLEAYTNDLHVYYTLTILAAALAALGLILNNTAIVIGAMVLAPLITPVIGLSLAVIAIDTGRAFKSLISVTIGSLVTLLVAILIGYLAVLVEGTTQLLTPEIFLRTDANIFYFLVALCSGVAGAYSYTKPQVLQSVTGIAIAVAVVPPLAVSGLSYVFANTQIAIDSFFLFLFNLAGIFFGSILLFLVIGFGKEK